jgi:hypothetical protein
MKLDKEPYFKKKPFFVFNQNSKLFRNNNTIDFNVDFTNRIVRNYGEPIVNSLFDELYPNNIELFVDIILYVIIVVNILTILFFTLVKDVEKEIVQIQINNILDSILIDEKTLDETTLYNGVIPIKKYYNLMKQNLISNLNSVPVNQEEEDKIKKHNDEIFKNSMIFLVILNVIGIIFLVLLWKFKNFDIVYYLKKNFVLGIFVVLTEILFLYIISKNYIYIDKKYIIKNLQKKITK